MAVQQLHALRQSMHVPLPCPLQVRALGGDAAVQRIPLGPIPHPEEGQRSGSSGQAGNAAAAAISGSGSGQQAVQQDGQHAPPPQQQAQRRQQPAQQRRPPLEALGDGVAAFDEIAVAAGALGRFPGSQVMPLIRQFVGLEAAA